MDKFGHVHIGITAVITLSVLLALFLLASCDFEKSPGEIKRKQEKLAYCTQQCDEVSRAFDYVSWAGDCRCKELSK